MTRPWEADPSAKFVRRVGKSPEELGNTSKKDGCPDMWELDNGDIAVIGRDLTSSYEGFLPEGARVASDERIVVIPGNVLAAAKSENYDG